ncbi:hypothetical protein [Paraburkholderia sp. 35.1]|uniref:hypothetical protein n=1 Tax=Paraburkholderia sp. 35.1 TaxID=2991058 RepID=UPI003D210077
MVVAWTASGLGTRRFCRERGLALSTFGVSVSVTRQKLEFSTGPTTLREIRTR